MEKTEQTPDGLKKVELGPKGIFKDAGKTIKKVKVMGVGLMQRKDGMTIFINEQFPTGTNAYAEGIPFDLNLPDATSVLQFVIPVIFLKI